MYLVFKGIVVTMYIRGYKKGVGYVGLELSPKQYYQYSVSIIYGVLSQ